MERSDWKAELLKILYTTGVIQDGYSGRLVININQGGITEVERVERIDPDPK